MGGVGGGGGGGGRGVGLGGKGGAGAGGREGGPGILWVWLNLPGTRREQSDFSSRRPRVEGRDCSRDLFSQLEGFPAGHLEVLIRSPKPVPLRPLAAHTAPRPLPTPCGPTNTDLGAAGSWPQETGPIITSTGSTKRSAMARRTGLPRPSSASPCITTNRSTSLCTPACPRAWLPKRMTCSGSKRSTISRAMAWMVVCRFGLQWSPSRPPGWSHSPTVTGSATAGPCP